MTIYILHEASYSEDGELTSFAYAYKSLEEAKAALKKSYDEYNALEENQGECCISRNGESASCTGPGQWTADIVTQKL